MQPLRLPWNQMRANSKLTAGLSASGGFNSGIPSDLTWRGRSGTRSDVEMPPRYWNSLGPSGKSLSYSASLLAIPNDRRSSTCPQSSRSAMSPYRAVVKVLA